jgi:hypothetical protein
VDEGSCIERSVVVSRVSHLDFARCDTLDMTHDNCARHDNRLESPLKKSCHFERQTRRTFQRL